MFLRNMLVYLGQTVKYPIIVNVDNNFGTIHLCKNSGIKRTRHVYLRNFYICDYVVDCILQIKFVNSSNNKDDSYTKNVDGNTEVYHHSSYMTYEKLKTMDTNLDLYVPQSLTWKTHFNPMGFLVIGTSWISTVVKTSLLFMLSN